MNMYDVDLLNQLFREQIVKVFDVYQSRNAKNYNFLLVIVVSEIKTHGLFVVRLARQPAQEFSDFQIDFAFPIDENFTFDTNNSENGISRYQIRVAHENSVELFYYLPDELQIKKLDEFKFHIFKVKTELRPSSANFDWILGYKKKDDYSIIDRNVALGISQPQSRESKFREELAKREDEYTTTVKYNVFTGTWNVNCMLPSVDTYLNEWLSITDEPPDIYAIALQEIDMKPDTILFSVSQPDMIWVERIRDALHPSAKYDVLTTVRFVGMQLSIFIKESLRSNIKYFKTDMVGTGALKYGNKGGVGVSIKLNETMICFVNSHLAAHQGEYDRRNEDFNEIVRRMQFQYGIKRYSIHEHSLVFWLGDLNYRVNTEMRAHNDLRYVVLGKFDQLQLARLDKKAFDGYEEGEILFKPTYKYDTGTDNFDSSEKLRPPAWCDRILWRGRGVIQLMYNSVMEIRYSDHKPVFSSFIVPVKAIDTEKYGRIHEEVLKLVDKHENDNQPILTIAETDIDFELVCFNEIKTRELIIANNCHIPASYEFSGKDGPGCAPCEPWIKISHPDGTLLTGDILNIQLTVQLDAKAVSKMIRKLKDAKAGEKSALDILVLHVKGGRDTFITLFGEYKPSVFGLSLETLVMLSKPVAEYALQDLIKIELHKGSANGIQFSSNRMIPREIWLLIDYLYKNCQNTKELFTITRKYSSNSNINEIREWLDTWSNQNFPGTPQSTAEALLLLFESTPDPLLCLSEDEISMTCDYYDRCRALIISRVSNLRRRVFLYVCLFIRELRKHYDTNHMNDRNLALIFSKVFIRPKVEAVPNNYSAKALQQVTQEDKRRRFIMQFFTNDIQSWAESELSSIA